MVSHRLRELIQMTSRGSVRMADEFGNCGKMKLFTTMDQELFLNYYSSIFPSTPMPVIKLSEQVVRTTNPAKLKSFLLTTSETEICTSE